jgi:hypothetical protein
MPFRIKGDPSGFSPSVGTVGDAMPSKRQLTGCIRLKCVMADLPTWPINTLADLKRDYGLTGTTRDT